MALPRAISSTRRPSAYDFTVTVSCLTGYMLLESYHEIYGVRKTLDWRIISVREPEPLSKVMSVVQIDPKLFRIGNTSESVLAWAEMQRPAW